MNGEGKKDVTKVAEQYIAFRLAQAVKHWQEAERQKPRYSALAECFQWSHTSRQFEVWQDWAYDEEALDAIVACVEELNAQLLIHGKPAQEFLLRADQKGYLLTY